MNKFDKIAWETIRNRPLPSSNDELSGRPKNFAELEAMVRRGTDFDIALLSFLDEFYLHRSHSFFNREPGTYFSPNYRSFLAAVAEFLSVKFDLPHPLWVDKVEYSLPDDWNPFDFEVDRESVDPIFLRHGVLVQSRSLIRL